MSGAVLGAGKFPKNKADKISALLDLKAKWGGPNIKQKITLLSKYKFERH